ncbi:hypothetical protein F1880_007726 [Penicillium rolfsii]|nr:hypothetical protein F1880_007726 [Penicillium rolfsii]
MVLIAKLLALALTATATPVLRRDAAQVGNDITEKIKPEIKTLYNDVQGFPASGLTGALTFQKDAQVLITTVNDATHDVKSSGSFSEDDGETILADLQMLTSPLLGTLSALASQADAWEKIPTGPALVLSDLKGLNATFVDFVNALLAASPADQAPSITSFKTQMVGGFIAAIDAYSS